MKNNKIINSFGTLSLVVAILAGFLLFPSASTVKQSNSEAIAALSLKMEKMTTQLEELKAVECQEEAWYEPTIGQIAMFAGNFAPRGWAFCDGRMLRVSENNALFSVLGTIYGGDGRNTFALPDLRGRVAVHQGNGLGLSPVKLGQKWGTEQVAINLQTMPVTRATAGDMAISGMQSEVTTMQPSLAVNYIIALVGNYPSRN